MLEKNYTNPEDKGRFGFSASGKYNAPYKAEFILIAIVIGAAVTAAVLTVWSLMYVMRENITGMSAGRGVEALALGIASVVAVTAIAVVAVFVIKYIIQGIKCSYIADEDKFTATVGGTPHTIYYKDVQNVHFLPRMFRGAVRGYTVTVKLNGTYEEFAVTSDNYISEQATPFYIIKERMEILRAAEERARARVDQSAVSAGQLSPEKKDEKQDTLSRVSSILGKDAEMPGISAAASDLQKNVPLPDISERVSPTVNGYADDMPAIGADGKIVSEKKTFTGNDGRVFSENDIISQGTFQVALRTKTAVIVGIIALAVYFAAFFFMRSLMIGKGQTSIPVGTIIMIIIAPFYAGTIINYLRNGREYSYKANGREFVVKSKKSEEHFFYKDVQSVTYKKMEFLWFIKGYRVEILTKYGITKYNYVFRGFGRLLPTSYLPFEVIRERIEK